MNAPPKYLEISNDEVRDTSGASINVYTVGDITNVHYAYFHKYIGSYANLNAYKTGLSYGHIDQYARADGTLSGEENDIPLIERNLQPIKKIMEGPTIEATMLLPEGIFDNYNFDKFVYIECKDFTGYFFVDSIQDYKDGSSLVRVDLLKMY